MPGRVAGKVAVLTGGSSGIGRASAVLLAREGASVVIGDIDEAGGAETVRLIEEAGGTVVFVPTDVSVADDVAALVEAAVDRFGRLDVLHNNAFWAPMDRPVTETSDEEWERTIDVCLRGTFHGCRAGIPAMVASGGGSIVNMTSVAGTKSSPRFAAYSAAKGGIVALTKSVAFDYGSQGIRANAISPGTIRTPFTEPILADDVRREYLASKILVGRVGQPEDIASAVLYLASDESSFVTGEVLTVDGGRTIS